MRQLRKKPHQVKTLGITVGAWNNVMKISAINERVR